MPAISAHLAADLIADGEQMPVYVWTIDHPAGRVLVGVRHPNGLRTVLSDRGRVSQFRQNATTTHFDTSRANYRLSRPALCGAVGGRAGLGRLSRLQ